MIIWLEIVKPSPLSTYTQVDMVILFIIKEWNNVDVLSSHNSMTFRGFKIDFIYSDKFLVTHLYKIEVEILMQQIRSPKAYVSSFKISLDFYLKYNRNL